MAEYLFGKRTMQPANIPSGSSDPAPPSTRALLLAAAPWLVAAVVALLALA